MIPCPRRARVTAGLLLAVLTLPASAGTSPAADPCSPYREMAGLTEAMLVLRNRHVKAPDFQTLADAAIDNMAQSLDPYSHLLQADALIAFKEETEGHLGGIGVVVSLDGDRWIIDYPMAGSPAFMAGIRAGDELIAVDGIGADTLHFSAAIEQIRGAPGSVVVLDILRVGEREPESIAIRRADIPIPSIPFTAMLTNGIGYAAIIKFSEDTPEAFATVLTRQLAFNPKAYVLDLRDNPGGLLHAAVAVADMILPANTPVAFTRGRVAAEDDTVYTTRDPDRLGGIPVAVLVNEGSASAAEVLAGAIRENNRGLLIGERTFGKAAVQTLFNLDTRPGQALMVTTAHYYTPASNLIHGVGLPVDIRVPQSQHAYYAASLGRMWRAHPELLHPHDVNALADAEDAPLEAAVRHLLQAIATGNGDPE